MNDLFTFAAREAERRKQRGMGLAADAQERDAPGFGELAYRHIVRLAQRHPEIHIDLFLSTFEFKPDRPNAMGSVWQRAIREKIIAHSGRVRKCKADPVKAAHSYPVYSSLVYRKDQKP